jgi:glycosyltransferase involved in cell wall biosynthesis
MIRVAVDGRVVRDTYHGIARHTLELLRVLHGEAVELVVFQGTGPDRRLSLRELAGEPGVELVPFQAPPASLAEQRHWPALLRAVSADVLFVPYHLATPWWSPIPVVTVIHDCIFEADPAFAPSGWMRHAYRAVTRMAITRATTVATVSEATRADLRRHYGLSLPPGNVVRHGVNPAFGRPCPPERVAEARDRLSLPGRYVLHVGVRRPHKNQTVLLRAFAQLARAQPDLGLVLVGGPDERFPDPVPGLVDELGLGDRVRLLSSLPEELLVPVYREASAVAFPSYIEGFGLPALEAMAAGVPVVASTTPAVGEVTEGAAVLVSPDDTDGWAAALGRVLCDRGLADGLRARGHEVVSRHTWDAAGSRTRQLLERVVAGTPSPSDGNRRRGVRWHARA